MKGRMLRLTALVLVLCMMLTGCSGLNFSGYLEKLEQMLGGGSLVPFSQMEYTRPDMQKFQQVLDRCCENAQTETNLNKMVDIIYTFYGEYDSFYTNFALAMIRYSQNMTNGYWTEEYAFCTENSVQVDAALDRFYRVLAKCPLRQTLEGDRYFGKDFFLSYEGDSIYEEAFLALLDREAELLNEYYALSAEAAGVSYYSEEYFTQYGGAMAELFVELIRVRQQQAQQAGYDSYGEFAYDFHHVRDYTAEQAQAYLADIRAELVPLYRKMHSSDFWERELPLVSEADTVAYVQNMAARMGGVIQQAFLDMQKAGLYDISYSDNKYNASFEIFLRNYATPYIFVNPTGTAYDQLTFAHEFGHFCNDYASGGSAAGIDVAEIFSQGMEYLSLIYSDGDTEDLETMKMASCLAVYVEQAAYASFEHQVYELEGDELTAENVQALYTKICTGYGFDSWAWDSRDFVCIPHLFTSPMYVISYVVSNDAALQLYQMERSKTGSGLVCLENSLTTMQPYFLAFLEEAGLESPFATGRLSKVKQTLQTFLE